MQSNDLKKILTGSEEDENDRSTNTKENKKYVLSKNMQFMMNMVDEERKNLYNKQWSKLDKSIKFKLINEYLEIYKIENELNDDKYEQLKKLLHNSLSENKLNKQSDVSYDSINHAINKINILRYNDKKKIYEIHIIEKHNRTNTKSKTNIDRLANGKNSSKRLNR